MTPFQPRLLKITLIAIALIATASMVITRWSRPTRWEELTIATATEGGTYHRLGEALTGVLEHVRGRPIEDAVAIPTQGAIDNIDSLLSSGADIAFIMHPALVAALTTQPSLRDTLQVLARLYSDVLQIVARKNAGINRVSDVAGRRVFIGSSSSGTRMVVEQVLGMVGVSVESLDIDSSRSFTEAAEALVAGRLDAAFFVAGTPTEAVELTLESGVGELLSLSEETQRLLVERAGLGFDSARIAANFYVNQPRETLTVGSPVYLVARADLPSALTYEIVQALFSNLRYLLRAHTSAEDIKLTHAFDIPNEFTLHPGARRFERQERNTLLIATGAVDGKYYRLGETIQLLLTEYGIRSRVVQSDGSFENAELLNQRPTIAVMQFDAALAVQSAVLRTPYNVDLLDRIDIPSVPNLRRLATFHREVVHIFVRREMIATLRDELARGGLAIPPIETLGDLLSAVRRMPPSFGAIRICLGPPKSGTQAVAEAILQQHEAPMTRIAPSYISVPEMVTRLHNEEIDAGFFVSYVPGQAMKTVLNNESIKLLSIGQKELASLSGMTVFENARIDSTYGSQAEGERAVYTIATRAVLVTTDDLPNSVSKIVQAIFEGEAFLNIPGGADSLAAQLPSLPLHDDARRYYQQNGFLPAKPPVDGLRILGQTLVILVTLVAAYKGSLKLKRDHTANAIGRRILAIPIDASADNSVGRLLAIRRETQERVRRRWWQLGEIDRTRRRDLRELIDNRIAEAKESLARSYMAEIRSAARTEGSPSSERRSTLEQIETRVWATYEDGEIDSGQRESLSDMIEKHGTHPVSERGE